MPRLPTPGGDDNQWGDILNEYMGVEHNADGTHKAAAVPDATTTSKGKIQLAGDLAGTAASPAVPGLAAKPKTVIDFGADPTGVADSTAAINAAGATGSVIFPPGTYIYTGTGITNTLCHIVGAGKEVSFIHLDTNSYLYHRNGTIQELSVKGLTIVGGKGAIRQSNTGPDSYRHRHIFDCRFVDYSECAIADLGDDTPYWKIRNCFFEGINYTTTIGVALAGMPDGTEITGCSFLKNRVGVKIARSGLDTTIRNCDFFRISASEGVPRSDIWLVAGAGMGGGGMVIDDVKFGPEWLETTDYHVVVADESSGTDFSTKMPALTTASTGIFATVIITNSILGGILGTNQSPPLLYTTTARLFGFQISSITFSSNTSRYIVESITPLPTLDAEAGGNVLGPIFASTSYHPPTNPTNCHSLFRVVDDGQLFEANAITTYAVPGGGSTIGYVNLMAQNVATGLTTYGGASLAGVTDSQGGADAIEITASASGQGVYDVVSSGIAVDGRPCFIEFDLKAGASSPLSLIEVSFGRNSLYAIQQLIIPSSNWTRHRYTVTAQDLAANQVWVVFSYPGWGGGGITGTKFQVGRIRAYQSREPILTDLDLRVATTTTTAPSAGAGQALPATPAEYVTVYINGVARKIAVY